MFSLAFVCLLAGLPKANEPIFTKFDGIKGGHGRNYRLDVDNPNHVT